MARDNRLDTLKGLLIILVIMGHVITSLDNANRVNHAVMGLIYIFHMPLFILISGYLTRTPQQQRPKEMWQGIARIALPLPSSTSSAVSGAGASPASSGCFLRVSPSTSCGIC